MKMCKMLPTRLKKRLPFLRHTYCSNKLIILLYYNNININTACYITLVFHRWKAILIILFKLYLVLSCIIKYPVV